MIDNIKEEKQSFETKQNTIILEKIDVYNFKEKEIIEFYRKYKKEINNELKSLRSDVHSNICHETRFKELRLYLLEDFKTNHKQFLTLFMLKLLYIVYLNKDNKYNIIYNIIYNNNINRIILGIKKDLLCLDNSNAEYLSPQDSVIADKSIQEQRNDLDISDIHNKPEGYKPETGYVFPFDISKISTGRSSILDVFNRFIKQYQNNDNVCDKKIINETDNHNLFIINKSASDIIKEYFEDINRPIKSDLTQEQETEEIENILNYDEYIEIYKNNKELNELNEIEIDNKNNDNIYIPKSKLEMSNLYTLINKYGEFEFKFLLSPLVKNKKFNTNTPEMILTNTKIKIIQKEILNLHENESIVSKLKYECPNCKEKAMINPNDLSAEVVHYCDISANVKTKILQSGITAAIQKVIILYKCDVCTNYDEIYNNKIENEKNKDIVDYNKKNIQEKWMNDVYIYSFVDNIEPGMYVADIVKFYCAPNCLEKKDKKIITYMMFGYKKEKIKYIEDKILKNNEEIEKIIENKNVDDNKKMQLKYLKNVLYKKKKFPEHKIWNIIFSIRQYYYDRFGILIDDNGLLMQLFTVITLISKLCFNENKIAISVMGVGSVSKTFPATIMTKMIDMNMKYISDSARMTSASMTGGINTSAMINNITTKKFEQGAISNNGIVIFDECQNVFLNPDMQSIIKSIPQDEYEVSVIGGKKVKFNCTPIFLSNFNAFVNKYEKEIYDAYVLKYKAVYKYESERKLKTNQEIIKYLSQINMHQNIEYYYDTLEDQILANVVFAVRKQYENKRIDWKTGSQLEAMNRILFDVVIHRKDDSIFYEMSKAIENEMNTSEISISENMPVQQMQEELMKYIYDKKNIDEINKINVKNKHENTENVKLQLEMLKKDIFKFLKFDELGRNINKYYSQNVDGFDKKIIELVVKIITILQLINDINAKKLDENTKELANMILLKCKRGLIQEEYNMEINVKEIKIYPTLKSDYLFDLEDTKTEIYYDEKRKKEFEKLEKEIETKYGLEKKENKDDSLKGLEIDIEDKYENIEDIAIGKQEYENIEDIAIENINDDVEWNEFNKKKINYNLKTMCIELGCMSDDENEQIEFIKKAKKDGLIFEPQNGVYKYV